MERISLSNNMKDKLILEKQNKVWKGEAVSTKYCIQIAVFGNPLYNVDTSQVELKRPVG